MNMLLSLLGLSLACVGCGTTATGPAVMVGPPVAPLPADRLGIPTPVQDPSGRALARFHGALRATEQGKHRTRVVVYGASHVAADSFTKVLRHRLQARFGDAGAGFIVPARPWRDHNHRDVNITYSNGWEPSFVSSTYGRDDGRYGLAGISFASSSKRDFCRIETARKAEFGRHVSRYEVYYWKAPRGGRFTIRIDDGRARTVKTRSRIAGPGYALVEVSDGPHSIELRPRGDGPVVLFGVAMDRDVPGVVMDGLGINGARAASQLEWDARILSEHLARRRPDLVVLAYGTNATGDDSDPIEAYERRLDLVINRVRSFVPEASCVYVGPSDRPVKVETGETDEHGEPILAFLPRPRQAQVIAAQRRVAERYGCGYWDWTHAMGGELSMLAWTHSEPRFGAPDYVHLKRAGYERIADLFWDALMGSYRPAVASGG